MEDRANTQAEECVHYHRRPPCDAEVESTALEHPVDFQKELQQLEAGLHHPLALPEPEVRHMPSIP